MNISQICAITAAIGFVVLMCFQFLLALGLPLGKAAWGGKYDRLPIGYRIGSFAAITILLFASISVLELTGLVSVFHNPGLVKNSVWIFTGFFALNTLGNLASKSKWEKRIMTPISLVLCLLCIVTVITTP